MISSMMVKEIMSVRTCYYPPPVLRDKIVCCSGSGTGSLVEPLSAVPLNDELQQARASIAKAEADVLLQITHKVTESKLIMLLFSYCVFIYLFLFMYRCKPILRT